MTGVGAVALAALLTVSSVDFAGSEQSGTRPVLFALQRNHRLHAFDAQTLQHLGHFVTGPLGDSLGVREDGRRLFLLQSMRDDPNSCCSLRMIDLAAREMCWISDFASSIAVGPGLVAMGDTLFNSQTLERLKIPRGFFQAYVSRFATEGRYVARMDRGPAIIFTDTATLRQTSMPIAQDARAGDWIGNQFALVASDGDRGRIWLVSPDDAVLPAPRTFTWPDTSARLGITFGTGANLVSYPRFGRSIMGDRRELDRGTPGGALLIPSAGGAARRIARDIYFAALIPGLDGRSLYGVEAGPLQGDPVPIRLVRLDAQRGVVTTTTVLKDQNLFPDASFDVWSLAIANVPIDLVPRGETQLVQPATATCAGRSTSSPMR